MPTIPPPDDDDDDVNDENDDEDDDEEEVDVDEIANAGSLRRNAGDRSNASLRHLSAVARLSQRLDLAARAKRARRDP